MPSIANQQITYYTVQWDTTPQFTNATSALASCASFGFGSCDLSGSAILSNPIQYIVQNLLLGVTYYIRVSASNSLSVPVSLSLLYNTSSSAAADNTNWSETVSYTTSNQQPDPPVLVVINENGPTNIQVLLTPPVNNGGLLISAYRFEYDVGAGITRITDGLQRVSTRRWNPQYQVTSFTNALGDTWHFEWNDERQLLGAQAPDRKTGKGRAVACRSTDS